MSQLSSSSPSFAASRVLLPTRCLSIEYKSASHVDRYGGNATSPNGPKSSKREGLPLFSIVVSESYQGARLGNKCLPFFLNEIRLVLTSEKSFTSPFRFAAPALTEVHLEDEETVKWSDIVTPNNVLMVCSPQEWNRYYIRNQNESNLGCITVDDTVRDAVTLRPLITSEILSHQSFVLKHFILPNGCPINPADEVKFSLYDLCSPSRAITISTFRKSPLRFSSSDPVAGNVESEMNSLHESGHSTPFILKQPPSGLAHRRQMLNDHSPSKNGQISSGVDKRLSFNTSKNMPRLQSPMTMSTPGKKFLISYVQKEGKDRAILLKNELERHGCTVFLDFENIVVGMDWQDVLNKAVKDCEVFVPIVTDSYGETLWTNREVKLADVMKKIVVPVSLIEHWPPSCLAIQFATTQHVQWSRNSSPWKDDRRSGSTFSPEEERECVKHVARAILDLYQQLKAHYSVLSAPVTEMETPPFNFLSHSQVRKRMPRKSALKSYPYDSGRNLAVEEAKKPREGKPLIVVCAHPSQKTFIDKIREEMGSGDGKFDIWSTTDAPLLWSDTAREKMVTPQFDNQNQNPQLQRVSLMSSSSGGTVSSGSPSESINGCLFQEKADEAGMVVLVLSAAFASSSICKHFLFYVERRKRIIPVVFEKFSMPGWMTTLIGNKEVEDCQAKNFIERLRTKLTRSVNLDMHAECAEEDLSEANILKGMEFLQKEAIPRDRSVYISGSGSHGFESAFLSREIANELAKLPKLCVATGGLLGVGEALSTHFAEVRKNNATGRAKQEECVYHVLPSHEESDQKEIANQNSDGTFNPAATGKTFFVGKSLRERETVVGRYFKVCVLIDGDTHSAHEATEAIWADNVVLPIFKSGGAAGGDYDFRMDKAPSGVSEEHWAIIRSKESTDGEIAVAVREIVAELLPQTKGAKKPRTPRTPKSKAQVPLTPSSTYSLRDRTGRKRVFEEDSPIAEEGTSSYSDSKF